MPEDNKTLIEIVSNWLEAHGYQGLVNVGGEGCSCEIGNIMECGEPNIMECVAAYRAECKGCDEFNFCLTINPEKKCPFGRG